jgi:O-antigen/teichoic acid export membrane protein
MTGFAGWSFLGSGTSMIANYGQGIVINLFFGTAVNAAQGVANQISGQLAVFATTLITALNPMIAKSEGAGNRTLMLKAVMMGSKVSFFLMMALHIPMLIEMPFILKLWLKNVPDFAVIFCRLLLIRNLIEQLFIPVASAISAEGNIKGYQITASILIIFTLPISYVLFKIGFPAYTLYIVFILYSMLASSMILCYAKKNCQLSITMFLNNVIGRSFCSFIIVFFLSLMPYLFIETEFIRFVSVIMTSILSYLITVFFIGFSSSERIKIKEMCLVVYNKVMIKKVH